MGCKNCKSNDINPIIEPVPVVSHEPISQLNDSLRESKTKKHETSSSDDQIIKPQNDVNFVKIEVADPQAFNKVFVQQRQQAIDNQNYRSAIESWRPKTLQQLVDSIKVLSRNQSLVDCHWIVFYWITCNIEYDAVSYFSKNYANQSAEGVFQTRKGVCAGYANIYKYLCDQLNISCEKISGYSKGYGFDEREDAVKEIDHVWNAIEIDHHWYLIESTWGSGHLTDQNVFQRQLDCYYFCPRPNEMIYHHLPENDKWQLLRKPIDKIQYMQMPKIHPIYFELNLELLSSRDQVHLDLLPNKSYAVVLLRVPSDVDLSADLKLHGQKIEGGHQIKFDKEKQLYRCYFAPNTIGKHKITIYGKRGAIETGIHNAAIELTLDINQMPKNPISFPTTWKKFFDLNLNIISPKNTHLIRIHNETHAEILIQTPKDVQLLGRLVNSKREEIEGGHQVFYDRRKELWRCKFAPNYDGVFDAEILAKKKSDLNWYASAASFTIEAKFIPTPPLSYPETWQLFHDLDLKIEAPQNRADAVWPENASFSEIRISAPDDVQLSCSIEYNGTKEENCTLAQFDNDKKQWQCLFAPQRTGAHKLVIYARRQSDIRSTLDCVGQFNLNVTKLGKSMKFPVTYTKFQINKCRIFEPLHGVLKKDAIVPIHCSIPGATTVDLQIDSKWVNKNDYKDPILNTKVVVGSTDVTVYATYGENTSYDGLIRYSVK